MSGDDVRSRCQALGDSDCRTRWDICHPLPTAPVVTGEPHGAVGPQDEVALVDCCL